ncbi:glycosyl transferase family protein [Sphingomonas sp. ac-8]|uniref:glycosyl transferase family protein n=1 Tax=Sphingomonas sp. ac-8 TaxID=3242977 RepID=UPI003A80039D
MGGLATAIVVWDGVLHEVVLFAAIGVLIGGIDDLATDLVHFGRRRRTAPSPSTIPRQQAEQRSGRLAIFVPAWDESAVIGLMLRSALARFDHPDYRIYAGAYPNDPATIAAVGAVAAEDSRVRLVLCPRPGPTTKADCLNALWHALLADQRAEGRPFKGVVLHDAEDLVHPEELRLLDQGLDRATTVQLPVLPLADTRSRWISGHYIDEFAEAHGKLMPVRQALGAGMPLAGTGCAIAVPMLARIAIARGGLPFDEASLTEDYELGLTIAMLGGSGLFLNVAEADGDQPVGVRAFFPATLDAAVRQKARWMIGIALAGWDRIGWQQRGRATEHWMRMRDRRTILAVPVLAAAYLALVGWGVSEAAHLLAGTARADATPAMRLLLMVNTALLGWRMAVRAHFVGTRYGWREGARSMPRSIIANIIALLAARRAMLRYLAMLRGAELRWDKTAHHFPDLPAERAA